MDYYAQGYFSFAGGAGGSTLPNLRSAVATSETGNIFYTGSFSGDALIENYTGNTIKLKRISGVTTPQAFNSLASGRLDLDAITAWEPTVDLRLHSVICQKTGTEFLIQGANVPFRTSGAYEFFGVSRNETDGTLTKTNDGGKGAVLNGGAYLEATGLTIDTTNGVELHLCFAPQTRKVTSDKFSGTGVDPYGSNSTGEMLFSLSNGTTNQMALRMTGANASTFASRRIGGGTDTFITAEAHTLQAFQPMVVGVEINGVTHGFRGFGAVDVPNTRNYQALNSAQQTAQSTLGTNCTIRIGRSISTSGVWSPTANIKVSSFIVTKSLSGSVADRKFRAKMRARMLYQTQQHLHKTKAEIEALFTANGGDVVYFKDTNPTTKTTAGIEGRVTYEWNQTVNNGKTPNQDFAYEGTSIGVKGVRNNEYRNTANTFNGSAPFMHDTLQGTMLAIMDVEDITKVDGVAVTSPSVVPVDSLSQIVNLGSRTPLTLGTGTGYSDKNISAGLAYHHSEATGVTRVADSKDTVNDISSYRPNIGSPTPVPYDGVNQAGGKYAFNTNCKYWQDNETFSGETMNASKWLALRGKAPSLPDNHVGATSYFNATRYHTAMMAMSWSPPTGYTLSTVPSAPTGQEATCKFYAGTAEGTPFTTPAYGFAKRVGNALVSMPDTTTTVTTTAYLGGIQTGTHLVHAFTKDVLSTDTLHTIASNVDVLLYD